MGAVVQFRGQFVTEKSSREEAGMETIAAIDRMREIVLFALPVVTEWRGNLIDMGEYLEAARAEVLALNGGSNDAA